MRLSLPRAQPVPGRRAGGVRIDPAIHVTAAARVPGLVGRRAVDCHPDRGRSIAYAALGIAERTGAGWIGRTVKGNPGMSRTTATASFGLPASTAPVFQRYRHCGGGRPDAACGRRKPPGSLPARASGSSMQRGFSPSSMLPLLPGEPSLPCIPVWRCGRKRPVSGGIGVRAGGPGRVVSRAGSFVFRASATIRTRRT